MSHHYLGRIPNFQEWLTMVKNQMNWKVKCLQLDNGREYKSNEFVQFYQECGIRREIMTPYNLEQNGIIERINRTIQEQIISMLQYSRLTNGFWAEALLMSLHIINMPPSKPLG
jgi:transposase InsO family protein